MSGGVVAVKMRESGFEIAWKTLDIAAPVTPLVVNGVVFTASKGDRTKPSVMYALDGVSGKRTWNSGASIGSYIQGGGISAVGSQVFLGTQDGTFYAFGFPIEH